jgi:hypothetical protein
MGASATIITVKKNRINPFKTIQIMENEIIDTGIQIEYKSEMDAYTYLFMFFHDEHGLTLLHSEMDDIIHACDHFKKIFNGKD